MTIYDVIGCAAFHPLSRPRGRQTRSVDCSLVRIPKGAGNTKLPILCALQLCYLQWILLRFDFAHSFLSGDSRRSISTDYSGHSSDGSDRQHAKSFQGVVAIHFKQVKCRLLKLLVS